MVNKLGCSFCTDLKKKRLEVNIRLVENLKRRILVVDDEDLVRQTIKIHVERSLDYEVIEASDGLEALEKIKQDSPSLIISDLKMPRMDGMALLEAIRSQKLDIPVLILTGFGQVEDALKAIRLGAKGFMKKPFDVKEVLTLIESIFTTRQEREDIVRIMPFIRSQSLTIKIPNNYIYINQLVIHIFSTVRACWELGEAELNDLRVALSEALMNAFEHGNLRVNKEEKTRLLLAGHSAYRNYLLNLMRLEENSQKSITCFLNLDPMKVEIRVVDEGEGFDYSSIYKDFDVMAPEDFVKVHGRGLFLIRTLMDEVSFNEKGNMIRIVKYRPRIGVEVGETLKVE